MSEKIFTKAFVKEVNTEERTLVAVASTENVDRDREIIEVSGWKLENFLKNPVLMWGHDYRTPPIGRVLWVKQEGDALKFKAQFHNKTQLASEVWELYKSGYLKAFSSVSNSASGKISFISPSSKLLLISGCSFTHCFAFAIVQPSALGNLSD